MLVPYSYAYGGSDKDRLLHIADASKYNRFQIKKVSMHEIDLGDYFEPVRFSGILALGAGFVTWCTQRLTQDTPSLPGVIMNYLMLVIFGLITIALGLVCLFLVGALVEATLIKYADTSSMQICWSREWPLCDLIKALGDDDWKVAVAIMSDASDLSGALSYSVTCYINDVRHARANNDAASVTALTERAVRDIRQYLTGETRSQMVTPSHSVA